MILDRARSAFGRALDAGAFVFRVMLALVELPEAPGGGCVERARGRSGVPAQSLE
jgi:hypothetical protein